MHAYTSDSSPAHFGHAHNIPIIIQIHELYHIPCEMWVCGVVGGGWTYKGEIEF